MKILWHFLSVKQSNDFIALRVNQHSFLHYLTLLHDLNKLSNEQIFFRVDWKNIQKNHHKFILRHMSNRMNESICRTNSMSCCFMSRSLNWIIAHMVGKEDFMVRGLDIKINKRKRKSCSWQWSKTEQLWTEDVYLKRGASRSTN